MEELRNGAADGKIRMGPDGLPAEKPEEALDLSGVEGNGWVGLMLLHTLFALEHNAICDRLRQEGSLSAQRVRHDASIPVPQHRGQVLAPRREAPRVPRRARSSLFGNSASARRPHREQDVRQSPR